MDNDKKMKTTRGEEISRKFLKISKIFCIASVAFLLLMQYRTIRVQDELINQQDELIQQMDENLQLQDDVIQELKNQLISDYEKSDAPIEIPTPEGDFILTTITQW